MSLLRLLCFTCIGLSGIAPAFAQTAVDGQIQGTVRDDSGAVLPGVTVTAAGVSTVGSARTVSDAEGSYRLVNLPPGQYQVEAELQGFSRFSQGGVQVRAARTILLDITLRIGSIEETVTVTAETPMLEVRRAVQAINIEGEFQRELPLSPRRDYTDFLEVTPGMNNYVNPQSGGGIYHLRGSTIESHVVQVDGADMTSFRQARPDYIALSSDALEDVEIKTAAADASSPLGVGVVINVVSPSGTNSLKGSAGLVFAAKSWNADNNPDGDSTTADIFQQDVALGGPILVDKAWFYSSFRNVARDVGLNRTDKELALHPIFNPGWEPFDNQFRGKSVFAKATTQLNSFHKLDGFYQWDSYTTENIVGQDNASYRPQDYAGIGINARLTSLWNDSLTTRFTVSYNDKSLNGSVGAFDGHLCFCPEQGPGLDVHEGAFLSSGVLRGTGKVLTLNGTESGGVQPSDKATITGDLTYYTSDWAGSHELKVGTFIQPRMSGENLTYYSNLGNPAFEEAVMIDPANPGAGLQTFHRRFFDQATVTRSQASTRDIAFYVQDAWTPTSRITINAGVRFDAVKGWDDQVDLETQDSLDIGPRFGITYMLTDDGRNVLRGGYGRVHELLQYIRIPLASETTANQIDEYDNNLDGIFETRLLTPGGTTELRNREIDPDYHQPYIDEWTVGFRRQFPGQVAIDAGFVRREYREIPARVEINGIYDGGVFQGYRNEDLNEIYLQTNNTFNWMVWQGLEFLITKRTSNFSLIGSYVRAWRHMAGDWQPNDPASFIQPDAFPNNKGIGIPRGNQPNSLSGTADAFGNTGWQDHTGRIAFTWMGPWDLSFATSYVYQHGPYSGPVVDRLSAPDPRFGPQRVTLSNGRVVSNPLATLIRFAYPTRGEGQVKADSRQDWNVRVAKRLNWGPRYLELAMDIFNLHNRGAIERYDVDAVQLYSPNYLKAATIQPPRSMHLSARFIF